ncbi:MaoC/PaaZ C-terminal domain-containing protein [Streptomyces sp. NBC_01537]|uniref:MaoC/PaaZ C-terminal domain-containing protein n=1 Tax=Streptomyces sp. NBC_01537 TaxID=2903896 RepID=UPI00386E08BC
MDVGSAVSAVRLYAEDLHAGAVFDLGSTKVSKEEILDFGRRFDPLPLHTDEGAAAASRFGGLIASGFHTAAVLQRLSVDAVFSRAALIAGREIDSLRMRAPVRPGDVLHGTMEIVEVRPRDDSTAVVRSRGTLTNDSGTVVMEVQGETLWEHRPMGGTEVGRLDRPVRHR